MPKISRDLKSHTLRTGVVASLVVAGLALSACNGDKPGTENTPTATASGTQLPSVENTASALPSGSASGSSSASASAAAPSTITNLDAITVTGAYGQPPKVTAKWPLTIAKTTTKVLSPGKGGKVTKGTVQVNYSGFNARTGKQFDTSFKGGKGTPVSFPLDQVIAGFRTGLQGQDIGSRVLIMMSPKDGYAQGNPQAGILGTDSLIFVVDIVSAQLDGPVGTPVTPKAGLPTVKDNGKGKEPTITIGSASKPTSLVIQPLIKGTGPAVKKTDGIVVNYTAVSWKTGKVVASNYETGPESGLLSSLIPGWQKGLVNQPAGSRILLVVPPADAYPKGNATPSIAADETLVYVVDILFTSPAS